MSDASHTKPDEAAAAAAAPVDTKAGEAAPASDAAPSAPAEKQDEAATSSQEESVPPRRRLDDAERLMALKQWEQAADEYAQALDGLREEFPDEHSPQLAPVLHRYGRSLLEHAIATSGALGGGGGQQDAPMPVKKKKSSKAASGEAGPSSSSSSAKPADPRFSFSGDADDDEEDEEEEEAGAQGQEEEDEDDLSVAFAVLDLARIIYQKLLDSDANAASASLTTIQGQSWNHVRIKNELAEVLNDLGDVGLETENFQQASSDYETSLQLLSPLLHPHSRRLADAYLRLGLALEFHPEDKRQAEAPNYVQSAANTLRARLDALQRRREILQRGGSEEARSQAAAAQLREEKAKEESAAEAGEGEGAAAAKGKGKGKEAVTSEGVPAERDDVAEMDEPRVERELKDVEEMIADLDAKLEDSNNNAAAAPNGAGSSSSAGGSALPDAAKQALQQAINEAFLGASTNSLAQPRAPADGPVNDLSGMVRKKKRPAAAEEDTGKGKGKEAVAPAGQAEEGSGSTSKKARVEDEAADA